MEENGDICLGKYAGCKSVRDEAYYAEDETEVRRRPALRHRNRHRGRVDRKKNPTLPPLEYGDKLLELYANEGYVHPNPAATS